MSPNTAKSFISAIHGKGKDNSSKIGTSDSVTLSDARKKAIELSELLRKEQTQKNKRPLERKNAP